MRQIISVFLLLGVIAVPLTDVLAEFYGQRCSVSAIIGRAVGGRRSAAIGQPPVQSSEATGGIGTAIIIGAAVSAGSVHQAADHVVIEPVLPLKAIFPLLRIRC